MVKRDELFKFIHQVIGEELIEKVQGIDKKCNGVQIHGSQEVNKLALGVSASLDFFKEVVEAKAQACVVHHGLAFEEFKYVYNSRLDQGMQKRLKFAFENELTVAGYHAALDIQPEFGNNATIIRELGAKRLDLPYFDEWGWVGEFEKEQEVKELAEKLSNILNHDVLAIYGGKDKIKRIGVCSGGAKPYAKHLSEIQEKQIDLHISGEITESGPAMAKDMGFNYFSGGHYATEVFGVQELGKKVKEHFKEKLEVEFIDIPNPL